MNHGWKSGSLILSITLAGCGNTAKTQPLADDADELARATDTRNNTKDAKEEDEMKVAAIDDVKREITDAVEVTVDYTFEKKDEYVRETATKLDEWQRKLDSRIEKLREKAKGASEKTQGEIQSTIAAIEKNKKDAQDRFADIKGSTRDAWKDVYGGMEQTFAAMKDGFAEAAKQFDTDQRQTGETK